MPLNFWRVFHSMDRLVIDSTVDRHLDSFHFWIILLWKIEYKCLYGHMILFLSVNYSGVKFLDYMVSVYLTIQKCQNIFAMWLYYFVIRPTVNKNSGSFTKLALTKLGIVNIFNLSHYSECIIVFHCNFNFNFLNDKWSWAAF